MVATTSRFFRVLEPADSACFTFTFSHCSVGRPFGHVCHVKGHVGAFSGRGARVRARTCTFAGCVDVFHFARVLLCTCVTLHMCYFVIATQCVCYAISNGIASTRVHVYSYGDLCQRQHNSSFNRVIR